MKFNGLFGNLDKSLKGITGCISDGSKYPMFGGRESFGPALDCPSIFNLHGPIEIQLMRMST